MIRLLVLISERSQKQQMSTLYACMKGQCANNRVVVVKLS